MTRARVCRKDSAQRKTNKMASEITFVGDEEIQFLSSVSLPNLRKALGKNFLESESEYEDYTSDSNDGSENILDKSCVEDASDMSDEDFPVTDKTFCGQKRRRTMIKQLKANRAEKRKRHPVNIFPLRTPIKVSRCYDTRLPCTCNFTSGRPQIFRALSGLLAPARRRFKSSIIFFISVATNTKETLLFAF